MGKKISKEQEKLERHIGYLNAENKALRGLLKSKIGDSKSPYIFLTHSVSEAEAHGFGDMLKDLGYEGTILALQEGRDVLFLGDSELAALGLVRLANPAIKQIFSGRKAHFLN